MSAPPGWRRTRLPHTDLEVGRGRGAFRYEPARNIAEDRDGDDHDRQPEIHVTLRSDDAAERTQAVESMLAIGGASMRGVLEAHLLDERDLRRLGALLEGFRAPPSERLLARAATIGGDSGAPPATRVAATRLDDVPTTPRSPLIIAEDAPIAALTASAIAHSLCLPRFMRDSSGIDVSSHKKRLGPWRLLEPLRSRPSWVWIERGPCCAPRVPIEETRGPNPARAFARVARDYGGGPRLREALSLYVILNHVKTPIQSSSGRIGNQIPVCVKL